jgi:hypothetical protein
MSQKPSIGRIVHYVMSAANDQARHPGDHRPAIITRVWNDTCVNLQVFTDSINDCDEGLPGANGVLWKSSATHDETGKAEGSWHWPEYVA